jgi:hypothetical protein
LGFPLAQKNAPYGRAWAFNDGTHFQARKNGRFQSGAAAEAQRAGKMEPRGSLYARFQIYVPADCIASESNERSQGVLKLMEPVIEADISFSPDVKLEQPA